MWNNSYTPVSTNTTALVGAYGRVPTGLGVPENVTAVIEVVALHPFREFLPVRAFVLPSRYDLRVWCPIPPFISHERHIGVTHGSLS